MSNNVSFQGTFLIKKPSEGVKNELKSVLKKHNFIFEHVNGSDALYITKTQDKDIAECIKKNNLQFRYYPELNTTSGFLPHNMGYALELIGKSGAKFIRSLPNMLAKTEGKQKTIVMDTFKMYPHLPKSLEALGMDAKDYVITRSPKGFHIVEDKKGYLRARISMPNALGRNYVQEIPKVSDDSVRRFEIDKNGQITKTYGVNKIRAFMDAFIGAAKFNAKK